MVIFFDIDGTLLPSGKTAIPDETVRAIAAARRNGHLAVINTGRARGHIDRFIIETAYEGERIFDGMISGCGLMGELRGELLWQPEIDVAACRQVIAAARECGVDALYEDKEGLAYDTVVPQSMMMQGCHVREAEQGKRILKIGRNDDYSFLKFIVHRPSCREPDRFRALAQGFVGMLVGDKWEEYVPVGYTKGTGLRRMMAHLGLPLEQSIAVGDSENDLPMLTLCPNSVAMGNGAAKEFPVSYVTLPIDEEGIPHMLRHFGLID